MAQYSGLSLRDIYARRCEELNCHQNSSVLLQLPTRPGMFDLPSVLDLSLNFVGPKGLVPLLEVVRCCSGLRILDLRDQHMSNESIELLCNVIQRHPSIVRVNLSNNPISIAGGVCLLDLAKTNGTLEAIILDNTDVKPTLKSSISNQLARNKQAREGAREADAVRQLGLQAIHGDPASTKLKISGSLDQAVARNAMDAFAFTLGPAIFDEDVAPALTILCGKYQTQFIDPQFTPGPSSIQPGESPNAIFEWRRIAELVGSPQSLFPAAADEDTSASAASVPIAVKEGYQWQFTCLEAAASESGGFNLRDCVSPPEHNPLGVYTVRFFIDGKWRYVVVDDLVPVTDRGIPAFAGLSEGCSWPCIIEKALAKLHGCYQALDRSVLLRHPMFRPASCCMTLADLTGGVGVSRDLHHEEFNPDEWFGTMLSLTANRALIVATTNKVDDAKMLDGLGLDANQAYHVLKVRQVNGFRLIRMRCTYSRRVYVGEWSSKSPLWDQYREVANALEHHGASQAKPGTPFWIPYTMFLHTFSAVHICRPLHNTTSAILEGHWDRATAGGPYFEPSWHRNPHYRLRVDARGTLVINLSLPDERFSSSEITTIAFHVVKSDSFPLRLERANLVARTAYVITNTVSYEGLFEPGEYWLVPSVYVANVLGKYILRLAGDVPFSVEHESMAHHWKPVHLSTEVRCSGEYQVGDDNCQFALSIPGDTQPARLFLQMHTPNAENLTLALFLCTSPQKDRRLLGNVTENDVVAKSKFLISSTVTLETNVSGGDTNFVILTCVNPETTHTPIQLSVWCSHPKFNVVELPVWKAKTIETSWERSGGYQEAVRNPQIEITGVLPLQSLAIRCQAIGCNDPSLVFFVVKNHGNVGDRLLKRIDDDMIAMKSVFVRHHTAIKEFVAGPSPCNSYIIVPCLQPPGSKAKCVVTVSSLSDTFEVREVVDQGKPTSK